MNAPSPGAIPSGAPRTPSLALTWAIAAVVFAMFTAAQVIEVLTAPDDYHRGGFSGWTLITVLIGAVGQAVWISFDRRRRGKEPGLWRIGAILCGPLAICIYLALEYRLRSLYLIPLALSLYVLSALMPYLASLAA